MKQDELNNCNFLLAYDPNGALLGFASFQRSVDEEADDIPIYYLYELQVSPLCQGMGVGTKLLREVEGRMDREEKIMLTVHTANKGAMKFYQRHGYGIDASSPRKILGPRHGLGYEIMSKHQSKK